MNRDEQRQASLDALTRIAAGLERQNELAVREQRRAATEEQVRAMTRPLRGFRSMAVLIPALLDPFTVEIPGEYWAVIEERRAEVACPCKEDGPIVAVGQIVKHDCGRAYLYTGQSVWVAWSPKGTEPVAVPQPDEDEVAHPPD